MKLWKLQKVELRKAWKHEALDFTNWLAEKENMGLLSDEIWIGLELIQTEASVWRFNLDILAEEENTWKKVVIENQLEMTDHTHLWQIVTYASWYDAEIIIWIVKDVRDEHKQAIDWLNDHTDDKINFFAIKMELWQIWGSSFAPKFQIISKPNDWAKAIKKSSWKSELSDTKLLQFDFWNHFKEYISENKSVLKSRKAYPQHRHDISIWTSEAHISLTINSQSCEIGCELYISNSKELFYKLEEKKIDIENSLWDKLEWMSLDNKKACRVKLTRVADINCLSEWSEYIKWLELKASNFQKVFFKSINLIKK